MCVACDSIIICMEVLYTCVYSVVITNFFKVSHSNCRMFLSALIYEVGTDQFAEKVTRAMYYIQKINATDEFNR